MIAHNISWHELIERIYRGKFKTYIRYPSKKETNVFDPIALHRFVDALPDDYTLVPVDEPLYH